MRSNGVCVLNHMAARGPTESLGRSTGAYYCPKCNANCFRTNEATVFITQLFTIPLRFLSYLKTVWKMSIFFNEKQFVKFQKKFMISKKFFGFEKKFINFWKNVHQI
uniref:Uncharacterized protein n=1 Tax=Triticum urartu TaxID=4572 RepID=A0A8R7TMV5_TRIUA